MKLPLKDAVRVISPRLTFLVTTVNKEGEVNAAPYSWVSPVSFNPPMVYLGIGGKHKHTFQNIQETGEFVLNMVSEDFGQQAVNCEKHEPGEDMIAKNNLHTSPSEIVSPPRVKEAKAFLECRLKEVIDLNIDHLIVIGEVVAAEAECSDGFPDLDKIKPLMHDAGGKFRKVGDETILKRRVWDKNNHFLRIIR